MNTVLAYLVAARRQESNELEKLSRTCELVLNASKLVHCLQEERGASNIFLASRGERFADLRQERILASDGMHEAVLAWLGHAELSQDLSGGARLYVRIALTLHTLGALESLRARIDLLKCTPVTATRQFNELIAALLGLVFEAADVAVVPEISSLLIALFHLMQGKEFAGQERAAGAAAYAAGSIDREQVQSIEYLIEMQEHSLRHFAAFADTLRAQWQALQSLLPLPELEQMRRKLISSAGRALDRGEVDRWFECCSRRMDAFHQIELHLADMLKRQCQERVSALRQELANQEQLFAMLDQPAPMPPQAVFQSGGEPGVEEGRLGPHLMQTVVDMLQVQSQRLQRVTKELASVRLALEERKLIERAKGILMAHQGLSEERAYRLLQQNAMNQKRRLADVAQAVISLSELLPGNQ